MTQEQKHLLVMPNKRKNNQNRFTTPRFQANDG